MTAKAIIDLYIAFFEKRGHKQIPNAPLIPDNDPTTLFTSSGMQPLVPYLLGEKHPMGKRLVNVQNSFRTVDIDEIGDNRHTTFFRMLGNWSLGDYFKKEQIPWFFQFLTDREEGLGLNPNKLFVTVFAGNGTILKDEESIKIWKEQFASVGIDVKEDERIFAYGVEKNWWSRAGVPDNMPAGEPGGPDTEVFYDFETPHDKKFGKTCHVNCDCGRYVEIGNSVFMQYLKQDDGSFKNLPQQNVDFGGGLERLVAATEHMSDVFETSLFSPIIKSIETVTNEIYAEHAKEMRIITDHFAGSVFMVANNVTPSNKEQGYILRRLIRRGLDHYTKLGGKDIIPVLESITTQYAKTDPVLEEEFEEIKNTILEEKQRYEQTQTAAKKFIEKKYSPSPAVYEQPSPKGRGGRERGKTGDELMGMTQISADDAFVLYTTHGLSPTQIKCLGYTFDDHEFAEKMEEHQKLSRAGGAKKFSGGLADHSELTIKGHTATHLLHQALRDILGNHVHQSGSNITAERVRFDFNYDKKLTREQLENVEKIIHEKIKENLPVHFELIPFQKAKALGAIGLFDEKYSDTVKIYFIGGGNPYDDSGSDSPLPLPQSSPKGRGRSRLAFPEGKAYSVEFCGGPHVDFTGALKSFTIIKEEGLGKGMRRIYAKVA